jgi:hypothetical protein
VKKEKRRLFTCFPAPFLVVFLQVRRPFLAQLVKQPRCLEESVAIFYMLKGTVVFIYYFALKRTEPLYLFMA